MQIYVCMNVNHPHVHASSMYVMYDISKLKTQLEHELR